MEALKLLNKRDVYLLESKEITELNYDFGNTSFIRKTYLTSNRKI